MDENERIWEEGFCPKASVFCLEQIPWGGCFRTLSLHLAAAFRDPMDAFLYAAEMSRDYLPLTYTVILHD